MSQNDQCDLAGQNETSGCHFGLLQCLTVYGFNEGRIGSDQGVRGEEGGD
jgi:hypothetical protein